MTSYEYRSCNTAVKYKDKKYNVNSIPENFMTQGPVVNDIVNVIKDMSLKEPSQGSINEIYKEFVDIHIKEMNRKLPTIKSTNNPHKKSKPFWTPELNGLYKAASFAEKEFVKFKGTEQEKQQKRLEFKDRQSLFDKAFRKAKYIFQHKAELEIETLVGKSGREMWQKIEEMGPKVRRQNIPEEVIVDGLVCRDIERVTLEWEQIFSNMYNGVPLGAQRFDSGFLTQIRSQNDHTNVKIKRQNSLNLPISVKEVISAVQKAKVKKAVSVDNVSNEVLKNASSVECLTEFYNFCFKNSLIPDMWRQSLISPIYKGKGKDRRDPKSYRPVSLVCNPCKIFSDILNKRLLSYLD